MPTPREIAAWRFQVISFLIAPDINLADRRKRMREIVRHGVTAIASPASLSASGRNSKARVSKSTLLRWAGLYRSGGIAALEPKSRSGSARERQSAAQPCVDYAITLLLEQHSRSLTQLEVYLRGRFKDYALSRSTLARSIRKHPSYGAVQQLRVKDRRRERSRTFGVFEAAYPHQCWQLDGKGPFTVTLNNGQKVKVHVLSVLDDYSRSVLATVVATSESTSAAVRVVKDAIRAYGLPERFQFDHGSAFDSERFRTGLAILGVHRNFVTARTPEWQGKIERFHGALDLWFIRELPVQEVIDLDHLQQLLVATIELLWNEHEHRGTGQPPSDRLANAVSKRRVSPQELDLAFMMEVAARSDKKTGVVKLPNGKFVVTGREAGTKSLFRFDPDDEERAQRLPKNGAPVDLEPFKKRSLPEPKLPVQEKRGSGQLQRLFDTYTGRPNCEAGFGLPEVFVVISEVVGRRLPSNERDGLLIHGFYKQAGPLLETSFRALCERTKDSIGKGHALEVYLDDLNRRIAMSRAEKARPSEETSP